MKRLEEFKSLSDFGFSVISNNRNTVVVPFENTIQNLELDINNRIYDGESPSEYQSMETLVSKTGETYTKYIKLDLNSNDYYALAHFGSLYTEINYQIQDIVDRYPNGFMFTEISISSNEIQFTNSATTYSDHWNFYETSKYSDYKVKLFDNSYTVLYDLTILSGSGTTATTTLYVSDDIVPTGIVSGAVYPSNYLLNIFADNSNKYQLNLLYPDPDTINSFPTFSAYNLDENIDYYTSAFTAFVSAEVSTGETLDSFDTNVMWNKYIPHGIKQFDSQQNTLYKLILVYSKMFDIIRNYQNQMVYAHTIRYKDYNHIPDELYDLLAQHFNWKMGFNNFGLVDQQDQLFDSYHPSIKKKLNLDSINNDFKVRILKNLIHFYKKKGTRSAFKVFQNLYSIPEQLMKLNEYVNKFDPSVGGMSLTSLPTNIIIPVNDFVYKYVNTTGGVVTVSGYVENTTFIDLEYSEANAIEYDYFDWVDSTTHLTTDINGNSILFGSLISDYSEDSFEKALLNTFVPSDGTAMYLEKYQLLENEYNDYLENSPSAYRFGDFDPYLDFIEGNIELICDQMIPAYSRILGYGRTIRNLKFHREKLKWIEPEPIPLPLQENVDFRTYLDPSIIDRTDVVVSTTDIIPEKTDRKYSSISTISELASIGDRNNTTVIGSTLNVDKRERSYVYTNLVRNICETIDVHSGLLELGEIYTGISRSLNSPYINFENEVYSSQTGTSIFYDFTDSTVIHSEVGVRVPMITTLYNLSESGVTELDINVYKLENDDGDLHVNYDNAVQTISLSAGSSYTGTFGFWINDPVSSPENNDYSFSGMIYLGGENEYGEQVLVDGNEYFYTYDLRTEIPSAWTEFYSASSNFKYSQQFDKILFTNSTPTFSYGGKEYRGNYFIYMTTPHIAEIQIAPDDTSELNNLSATIVFSCDETAQSIFIDYFAVPNSTGADYADFEDPGNSLSGWSASTFEVVKNYWDTYATKTKEIVVNSSNSYNVVLSFGVPNTWYWWRIRTNKRTRSSFNYSADLYSTTDPRLVKSGSGDGPQPVVGPKIRFEIV